MKKNLINEINRMKEIMGIELIGESYLLTEARITDLFASIAKAGRGVDDDTVAAIFEKIHKNAGNANFKLTALELSSIRRFISNSNALDSDIYAFLINRNGMQDMDELVTSSFGAGLDNINTTDDITEMLSELYGDASPAVKRYMVQKGYPFDDIDLFKSIVDSTNRMVRTATADKLKIGEMSRDQVIAFLKRSGYGPEFNSEAGRRFRKLLEFVFGDYSWFPSGDEVWKAYTNNRLQRTMGRNAPEQLKNFVEELNKIEKAMNEVPTLKIKEKARLQKEFDRLIGKTPGFDSLPPTAKLILGGLYMIANLGYVVSTGSGLLGYQNDPTKNAAQNLGYRLLAGFEGFIKMPAYAMDAFEWLFIAGEALEGNYVGFPEYEDTEEINKLKGYVVKLNGKYEDTSGQFNDNKYAIEIPPGENLTDRTILHVIDINTSDILDTYSVQDINSVLD